MATEKTNISKEQETYKRDFDQRATIPRNGVIKVFRVLFRREYNPKDETKHSWHHWQCDHIRSQKWIKIPSS